ncbi:MAG: hypothetical protein AAF481_00330 [Acidobacteriota bacterium]
MLGGLAFTAAAALLAAGTGTRDPSALSRSAKVTVATAIAGALCLVSAALMWSFMSADMSRALAKENVDLANRIAQLNRWPSYGLLAGVVGFFTSIGASGWIASRKLGLFTTVLALAGGLALVQMLFWFADF